MGIHRTFLGCAYLSSFIFWQISPYSVSAKTIVDCKVVMPVLYSNLGCTPLCDTYCLTEMNNEWRENGQNESWTIREDVGDN